MESPVDLLWAQAAVRALLLKVRLAVAAEHMRRAAEARPK
jgi:hypothetical protein